MRRDRLMLFTTALSLLALVCVGAAMGASGEPQKKHTPLDMAKARTVVLRVSDLGAGWKASRSTTNSGGTPRCKSFQPDESDLTETGTADSPDFQKGFRFVSSAAGVFKSAAQAQASWDRVVKPGLLGCLGSIFNQGASTGKATTKILAKGSLSFPRLAPRTAAYRIKFSTKTQGLTLGGTLDLILLGNGRIDALMISVSFGTPPLADEQRLASLIAHRLS